MAGRAAPTALAVAYALAPALAAGSTGPPPGPGGPGGPAEATAIQTNTIVIAVGTLNMCLASILMSGESGFPKEKNSAGGGVQKKRATPLPRLCAECAAGFVLPGPGLPDIRPIR